MLIISKKLSWVSEYLELVSHLVPLERIRRIASKTPTYKENQLCHGIISRYYRSKYYKITIYTAYQRVKFKRITNKNYELDISIQRYSKIDLLQTLAHELAHSVHWDHTVNHKMLELAIQEIFMVKLSKEGYVSEEYEKINKTFIV